MTTAAVYARISKFDGEGTSAGVKRQQADCRALAKRKGWNVAEVYVDDDRSAFSGKERPGYRRLLADLEAGAVDAVIAWHPDRLHRSPRELEDFIDVVETTGAAVATCTAGDYDLALPEGRLMARIVGSVARKESEDKSRRLRRKHEELAQEGRISGGGRRPFGYEADRVTIRPDEAVEIKAAARRVLAGESVRSVVYDWRDRGVRTVTGAEWSPTTVKRLLQSGRISGQREHHGQIVGPATWPAIISSNDTARLRAILSDPRRNKAAGTAARSYLLTGFVYCARCGVKMGSRPTARGKRRYVCTKDRGGCDRCGISADNLEPLIVEAVMQALDGPGLAEVIAARDAAGGTEAVDAVAALEADLELLARDHYVDHLIGRAEFLAARSGIEERLQVARAAVAQRRPADALDGIGKREGALRKAWPGLSLDRRRAIIASVVERVEVAPTERADNRFNPDRVAVVWRA